MTASEALEKLLPSFASYYDVVREDVTEPFAAEAVFHSHDSQYFLVRRAVISEAESNEYVFFAAEDKLTAERLRTLDETAWETGMSRVEPHASHRNSDVSLIVLADVIEPDAAALIKKLHRSKSYRFTLQGWSNYRVIALETSSGRLVHNRLGRGLRKILRNINSEK